jgi:glycosidase
MTSFMRIDLGLVRCAAAVGLVLASGSLCAMGQSGEHSVMLQWFDQGWRDMERRVPDMFKAGYGSVWLPPPGRASAGSVGYDVFDRFDLGRPGAPTAYGTESMFSTTVKELQRANAEVYIDSILNHNSGRQTSASFQANGGWPGFWMAPATPPVNKQANSNWGDFHNNPGSATFYLQSENPGGAWYDTIKGDLVAFIRHPVVEGNPQNIPAGTTFNRPDPNNARFYPDQDLAPLAFVNPAFAGQPAVPFSLHPYNTAEPLAGDPVPDNATGLLMRYTQWMLDVHGVDGFRLDASKHAPSWFWIQYFDAAVYNRRTTPDGRKVTAFSFGENTTGNTQIFDEYIRKPNGRVPARPGEEFGNRDSLDLAGAGALRNLRNANGFGVWGDVLSAHLDVVDDGFNNGTLGVNHVFSHDNGTIDAPGSIAALPSIRQQALFAHAYVLTRPGLPIVYYNGRGVTRATGAFWPDEGTPVALGLDPNTNTETNLMTAIVQARNFAGRGQFFPLNSNPSDVLIYELSSPRFAGAGYPGGYSANMLVGTSDSYASGSVGGSVTTTFPQGTRLQELTGNAANPSVDPTNIIPETIVVGPGGVVNLRVPHNVSSAGEHNRGYVIYAPTLPAGTLEFSPVSSVIAADSPSTPTFRRRLTSIPVVTTNPFTLRLTTTKADAADPNHDDNALFRFNSGYRDLNGNGQIDFPYTAGAVAGFEQFLTTNQPLFGSASSTGLYEQVIDASAMDEGVNYVTVRAFRKRNADEAPLYREFREVVYIDLEPPAIEFIDPPSTTTATTTEFRVRALDRTTNFVYLLANVPDGVDPTTLVGLPNLASRFDRLEHRRTVGVFAHGFNTVTAVATEESGNTNVIEHTFFVDLCAADYNKDGASDVLDFLDFLDDYSACDGQPGPCGLNGNTDFNGDGTVDVLDFLDFFDAFAGGC